MSNSSRSKKYILNQKSKGLKRVSFFTDEKFWKYITKRASKDNISINDFLKNSFDFK